MIFLCLSTHIYLSLDLYILRMHTENRFCKFTSGFYHYHPFNHHHYHHKGGKSGHIIDSEESDL